MRQNPSPQPEDGPRDPEREEPSPGEARDVPVIGRSITVRGDVTGEQSLVIRGRVRGNVLLGESNVFVDPEGRVTGDIHAQIIRVEGRVEGRLVGAQRVVIRSGARVRGEVRAPRVTLEDGCRYSGKVESGPKAQSAGTRSKAGAAIDAVPRAVQKTNGARDAARAGRSGGARPP